MMLGYLVEKEFKQIFRDKFLPKVIFAFPFIALILLPFAANYDIKNIRLTVVDNDKSSYSRELINRLSANHTITFISMEPTYDKALDLVHSDKADMIIDIPKGLEKNYITQKETKVLLAVNSVNGIKGSMGGLYALSIINDYSIDKTSEVSLFKGSQGVEIKPLYQYNKVLNYKLFMVPALMVMILTIICGFLPTLNIVGEKEKGNMEQINVSPIPKPIFILSKLIPYWVIGIIVISIGFIVAWLVYDLVPQGNILTIYFFSFIFTFAISGVGLILSNYASTYQQAMFMMFFFVMILILMSGLYTPFNSMPPWAQVIGSFSPLKYLIEVMRNVYLKGSKISELLPQLYALLGFVVVFYVWAMLSYRKKS
jgi:ABC-2 type transport system permease protein